VSIAICAFRRDNQAASRLASHLDIPNLEIGVHQFPDGETLVTGPEKAPTTGVVYCSLSRPDERIAALIFAVDALRRSGSERVVLVSPYMPYMRQDAQFEPGQAISQRAFGRLVAGLFDRVITVDAHLHRTRDIGSVFPAIEAENLSATATIAEFAAQQGCGKETLIAGPDTESGQWVARIARLLQAKTWVGEKVRYGDKRVDIRFPEGDLAGRRVLIADDIISSGGTMIRAIAALKSSGAGQISVAVTHALFNPETEEALYKAGASDIWSTDSVCHHTSCIQLAPLLAASLHREYRIKESNGG